jgi:hypothetical protein
LLWKPKGEWRKGKRTRIPLVAAADGGPLWSVEVAAGVAVGVAAGSEQHRQEEKERRRW